MARSDYKITKLPFLLVWNRTQIIALSGTGPIICGTGPTNLGPVMLDRVHILDLLICFWIKKNLKIHQIFQKENS